MSSVCFHCGLPNPPTPFTFTLLDEEKLFCCLGCQSAAQTIIDSGLGEYYRFHQPDSHPVENDLTDKITSMFTMYDRDDVQSEFVTQTTDNASHAILLIEGISCSACTWLIEKRLLQIKGVITASVNSGTHRLTISWNTSVLLSDVFKSLFVIGYRATPYLPDNEEIVRQRTHRKFILRLGVAGVGMMQAMMNAVALYSGQITQQHELWLWWTSLFLTLPVIFISAWPFFTSAWNSLVAKHLSMDVSVSAAVLSAFLASVYATVVGHGEVYFESVNMFVFFIVLSRFLEFRARTLSHKPQNTFNSFLPKTCEVTSKEGTSHLPLRDIRSGDIIKLAPGETSAFDGIVTEGQSEFDESSFTGEFKLIPKQQGDSVSAGTTNQYQPIYIEVKGNRSASSFNLLQTLIERASSEKSRLAVLADKGSQQFIFSTLIVSVLIGLAWLWIDPDRAFWIVVSVLVVTCPCALSLATPTALAQATLSLKRQGVVVTRGYALERLAALEHIAFDKTGTLTEGSFSINKIELMPSCEKLGLFEHDLLQVIAQLEKQSEHSIASAFRHIDLSNPKHTITDISIIPNKGIKGASSLGNWRIQSRIDPEEQCDGNQLSLLLNEVVVVNLVLTDLIRSTVAPSLTALAEQNISTHILTGDPSPSSEDDFRKRNLSGTFKYDCSPEQKIEWTKSLPSASFAVVGDGLNDAPLLATAPLSLAMLNATDMTKSQADILLLTSDLQVIPTAIGVARKTQRIIKQNLIWALIYNVIALPIAALGLVSPWQAAIGMSLSSLLVVGNALRLRK